MIGVYKLTNKINGKCYIGQSINIKKRIENHMCLNGAKVPGQVAYEYPIYRAIRKYGRENFEWEVLEECTVEELEERELYYITKYRSIEDGYNQTNSTANPILEPKIMEKAIKNMTLNHRTIEHREKQREITKKLWEDETYRGNVIRGIKKSSHLISKSSKENWGRNRSKYIEAIKKSLNTDEVRKRRSDIQRERLKDKEYAEFINDVLDKGRKNMIKKLQTDPEYKRRVVEKQRKAKLPKSKGISMLDKQGNFIKDFVSLAEATRWIIKNTNYKKADYSTIRNSAKRKGTAYGYRWRLHKSQETIRKE